MIEELRKFFDGINGIHSVILFGSYARGENKKSSDVDVLVISESKIDRGKLMRDFFERFGKVLSIVNLTKKEFFDRILEGNPQLLIIFLEGIVIKDDGTFKRGKNLYTALHRKENWIVKYGGKVWSPRMLNTRWTF